MRRDQIIARIREAAEAAKAAGKELVVVEKTKHTGLVVGSNRTTLTRSSSDFGPNDAADVWKNFEGELGEGWWK